MFWWADLQAPFPPVVTHGPLLSALTRSDRVTRSGLWYLSVRAAQTETRKGVGGWTRPRVRLLVFFYHSRLWLRGHGRQLRRVLLRQTQTVNNNMW